MENKSSNKNVLSAIMILMVIFGFILLSINEFLFAKVNQPISKMKYRTISADVIDEKNNNKLIITTGKLTASDKVTDEIFDISVNSPILERVVEVYTCQEVCEIESYTRKCKAVTGWSTSLRSDVIKDSPICDKKVTTTIYPKLTMYNENSRLGAFELSTSYLSKVPVEKKVLELNEETAKKLNLYIVDSAYTTTPPNTEPKAGDIRVTFYYAEPVTYTVLGEQNNNRIEPYVRASGYYLTHASLEKVTGQQILETKSESVYYAPNLWKVRGISLLLIIGGVVYPTIVFCNTNKKFSRKKIKMVLITTSTAAIASMLVALSLWSLYQSYPSDNVIGALVIAGSALFCLVGAILSKPVPTPQEYRDSFREKYGYLKDEHPTFNLSSENQINEPTYERRHSYENPYKRKNTSKNTSTSSQSYDNSYKNPYKNPYK